MYTTDPPGVVVEVLRLTKDENAGVAVDADDFAFVEAFLRSFAAGFAIDAERFAGLDEGDGRAAAEVAAPIGAGIDGHGYAGPPLVLMRFFSKSRNLMRVKVYSDIAGGF